MIENQIPLLPAKTPFAPAEYYVICKRTEFDGNNPSDQTGDPEKLIVHTNQENKTRLGYELAKAMSKANMLQFENDRRKQCGIRDNIIGVYKKVLKDGAMTITTLDDHVSPTEFEWDEFNQTFFATLYFFSKRKNKVQ